MSDYPRQFSILFFGTLVSASGSSLGWPFMTIYMHERLDVPLTTVGLIMATNAAMVVLFQYRKTRMVSRYRLGPVLASGSLFVALGVGTVALSSSFVMFLLSMVIVTIGELIFAPSSTAFVADVAPEAMRGPYMAAYGMTWGLSFGLGPIVGGIINDRLGPVFVWQITAAVGLVAAASFLLIGRKAMSMKRPLQTVAG
ncbi:MAG: MFS transporter [Anaerolineae bacterium]